MSDLVDDIRVEVQLPPKEGDNLLTNTSGQYGAWQWATANSVSGVSITGDSVARTIKAQRDATAGFTAFMTDFLPVTPGKYANARVDLTSITSGHKATLGIQFYNASYVVQSWSYSSPSSTLATLAFSSVLVPAGVSYVRLLVILDKTADPLPDSGSANASAQVTLTKAMITEVTASGTPSEIVTNLMPNGGFQYVTTGWSAGTNIGAVSRTTPGGGQYYLRGNFVDGVSLSNGEYSYINGSYVTGVEAGATYSLRVDTYFPSGLAAGHTFTTGVLYRWFNNSNVQIGGDTWASDGSTTLATWHQAWRLIQAPAGATKLRLFPYARHSGVTFTLSDAWYFQIDSISIAKSNVLQPYFDGDTTDTASATYDWTGTAGNSTSTRTSVGAVPYVEPDEQFVDITGGYNQFITERSELDIETMSGTIVDPALSPARAGSIVKPGRGIRVWAWDPAISAFRRKFTGRLGPCSVDYDPLNDEDRNKVKITVSATGNTSLLAQASRPGATRTAANLAALVLAGAGVPWEVNGSTGIVSGVVDIATIDNATALDQVALTRDTVGGYAWVDPYGKLWFHSTLGAKSTGPATMGASDYTAGGLKVSFSTDRLINSVNIIRLIRASDGSTEERSHGPYEDPASIREWGAHSPPGGAVTIASIPSDTAQAATRGAAILAANATPVLVVEDVAINSADNRAHAFHDLYDLITVSTSTIDGDINTAVRITTIRDEFTTERRPGGQGRWKTTYSFMANGGVATPAIQPPVTSNATGAPLLLMNKNSSALALVASTWTVVTGWDIVTNTGFTSVAGSTATIASAGVYYASFTCGYNAVASRCLTALTLNSTSGGSGILAREDAESTTATRVGHNVTAVVRCAAGDVIRGLAWSSAIRNVEQNLSVMNVYRLGD